MSILLFIVILVVLILVHELGHFGVAKFFKIRVDEFGIGFPPRLFSWGKGETKWSVNAVPFGGFVRIYGEDGEEGKGDERSFIGQKRRVQAAVVAAGVVMNIIFAWVLLSLGYMYGLPTSMDHAGLGEVRDIETIVVSVLPESPAKAQGIMAGDAILDLRSSQGAYLEADALADDVRHFLMQHQLEEITFTLRTKDESERQIVLQPQGGLVEGRAIVGIVVDDAGILQLPPHGAFVEGARLTYNLTLATGAGLYDFFSSIVKGTADFSTVAGPIGIVGVVDDASALGIAALITLTAVISINLALINLIPFPALDGGRLLIIALEGAARRSFPKKFLSAYNMVGFALLMLLMIVVTYHDILRLVS